MELRSVTFLTVALSLSCIESKNLYGDHGLVITSLPFTRQDYKQLISIPYTPDELKNATDKDFPGFEFDLKQTLISCDVDYDKNYMYYYDFGQSAIRLAENFNTSMIKDDMTFTIQHQAVSEEYVKIAVDWLSHNVYWTDPLMGWIVMQPAGAINDPTLYDIIVSEHLDLPRGLAVDSIEGLMFWTDAGETPRIERATLIGTQRQLIKMSGLTRPNALTVDTVTKQIYWVDGPTINRCSYEGRSVAHVQRYTYASYFDVAIFENTVIVTDIEEYFMHFYNKRTGDKEMTKIGSDKEAYFGIAVYHESSQARPRDKCANFGCEHMCVDLPTEVTCLCKMGFKLEANGKKCTEKEGQHFRGIVLNTVTSLCIVDLRTILDDDLTFKPTCFYEGEKTDNITWMDLNMRDRLVYFAMDNVIYSVAIDGTKNIKVPLEEAKHKITGLTYDWVNEKIYYSIMADGSNSGESVWMFDLSTKTPQMLREVKDGFVRGLVVVPHSKKIFWLSGVSTLEYSDLGSTDASFKKVDVEDGTFVDPVHMYHDIKYEQLYILDLAFVDDGHDIIKLAYNGTFNDYLLLGNTVLDFGLYRSYILYAEMAKNGNGTILRSTSSDSDTEVSSGKLPGIDDVIGIKILDLDVLQKNYPSPCGSINEYGGCDHICVPFEDKPLCSCRFGFTLQDDKKTCKSTPVMDDFILVSDRTYDEILQLPLNDFTVVHGIETQDTGRLAGVMYNYMTEEVVYANTRSDEVLGVFLNGSNYDVITDVGNNYASPDMIALDPSTGNLYYTAVSFFNDIFFDSYIGVIAPSGEETVVVYEGHYPRDIVVHPAKGEMYWTEHGDNPGIFTAFMDGNNIQQLIQDDAHWCNGLVLDYKDERLYWTDGYFDEIYSTDLQGNDRKTIYTDKDSHMVGLAMLNDYLYYTAWDNNHITKIHKSDPDIPVEKLGPKAGLGRLHDIHIYSSAVTKTEVPVNKNCQQNNGGCSHFCLPTPTGNSCGCPSFNDLLADGRTCENAPRCPGNLETAIVTDSEVCLRLAGNKCNFECKKYHSPNPKVTKLTCLATDDEEVLKWDVEEPCIETLCPLAIPNGKISSDTCTRKVESDCDVYTCNPGYERNEDVKTPVSCQESGDWKIEEDMPLCKLRCPKPDIDKDNVEVGPSCPREPNSTCRIYCQENYKPNVNRITCQANGQWSKPVEKVCSEVLCPDLYEGFKMDSNCSFKVGVTCTAECLKKYVPVSNAKLSLKCNHFGQWDSNPCKEQVCPDFVTGGEIKKPCKRTVGSTCSATCMDGYMPNDQRDKVTCNQNGTWDGELCQVVPQATTQDKQLGVGVGVGVGMSVIVIVIILVILIIMYRRGMLPIGKQSSELPLGPSTAFENPRYVENSVNIEAAARSQGNKDFGYATLEEDSVPAPKEPWHKMEQETQQPRVENVYDNPVNVQKR